MATKAADTALAAIDAEISARKAVMSQQADVLDGLLQSRSILAAAMHDEDDPIAAAPKAKRTRGPNKKRGLPATGGTRVTDAAEDESARMAV